MFFSPPPYHDLIFQDATRQLRVVHPSKRNYAAYVGKDFLRARRITDCDAGANSLKTNSFLLTLFVGLMICLQSMF
jgi:melanoma-associated antigen p97